MNLKYLIPAFLAIPFLSACDNDDVDTTKPVIEIESPADHAHFDAGQDFDLIAIITDNDELASWKVSIHYNEDGHSHQKSASAVAEEEVEWQQYWSGTIEAGLKSFELTQTINIPTNAQHGEYHLGVYALDKSGNEQVVFIEIEVEDEENEH